IQAFRPQTCTGSPRLNKTSQAEGQDPSHQKLQRLITGNVKRLISNVYDVSKRCAACCLTVLLSKRPTTMLIWSRQEFFDPPRSPVFADIEPIDERKFAESPKKLNVVPRIFYPV
ncbi:hypothetical protein BaRGS_00023757, partial [Batillaria attramentaria]